MAISDVTGNVMQRFLSVIIGHLAFPLLAQDHPGVARKELQSAWTEGCYIWDYRYQGKDIDVDSVTRPQTHSAFATGVLECQQMCNELNKGEHIGCAHFVYYPDAKSCYFESEGAELVADKDNTVVSGPPQCESPSPTCTGYPDDSWPGGWFEESMQAWPAGYQPMLLQCWLRFKDARIMPCKDITVLEDTEKGWPGKCNMMTPMPVPEPVIENCKRSCYLTPECPGWQVNHEGKCFHGMGTDCWENPTWGELAKPKAAQRLMHGSYRVLKKWDGMEIMGLRQVFNKENSIRMSDFGEDPAWSCKMMCLSKTRCQFWQLDNMSGCWIEDPQDDCWIDDPYAGGECVYNSHTAFSVPYPLTTEFLIDNPNALQSEYIQRFCNEYRLLKKATTPLPLISPPRAPTTVSPPVIPAATGTLAPQIEKSSPTFSVKYMAVHVHKIPGYDGQLRIRGAFNVSETARPHTYLIKYALRGLEPGAEGAWHVHSGTSCESTRGHYLLENGMDPWEAKYKATPSGTASDKFTVSFDKGLIGHTLVVHLQDKTKAACGVIESAVDPLVMPSAPDDKKQEPVWLGWALLVAGAILGFMAVYTLCTRDDLDESDDAVSPSNSREMLVEGSPLLKVGDPLDNSDVEGDGMYGRKGRR